MQAMDDMSEEWWEFIHNIMKSGQNTTRSLARRIDSAYQQSLDLLACTPLSDLRVEGGKLHQDICVYKKRSGDSQRYSSLERTYVVGGCTEYLSTIRRCYRRVST